MHTASLSEAKFVPLDRPECQNNGTQKKKKNTRTETSKNECFEQTITLKLYENPTFI